MDHMDDNIVIFSVVRDFPMYKMCIRDNFFCKKSVMYLADNSTVNKCIPKRYNEFLNTYDFSQPAWFIFCHEDFEIRESIEHLLRGLPTDALYGPIGCARKGIFPFRHQVFLGQITEEARNKSGKLWDVGRQVTPLTRAETFDCCCLIVHSSLIEKFKLRFDEELAFDLYVEDFCAMARLKHNISSRILPLKAIHHSGSKPNERLYRHLPYLMKKYPHNCFCASCTYFGTPSSAMKFEQWIAALAQRFHFLR